MGFVLVSILFFLCFTKSDAMYLLSRDPRNFHFDQNATANACGIMQFTDCQHALQNKIITTCAQEWLADIPLHVYREKFMAEFDQGRTFFVMIDCAGDCVGFVGGAFSKWFPRICNLYVYPAHRSRGHGSLLFDYAMEAAKRAGISTVYLWTNENSLQYYMSRGFEVSRFSMLFQK